MAGANDIYLFPDKECRLVLIGKTGSGKSSTGNTILGRQAFKSQTGMNSETKQCGRETVKRNDILISVVDTPGLSDTDGEDSVIAERITKSLLVARPGPHALLLVLRCDSRFTDEEVQVYKALKDIFGHNMTGYLIVIFVGKDRLKNCPTFEQQIEKAHKLQIILGEASNRYVLFSNEARGDEREEQVNQLLGLVKEVVRMNQRACFRFRMVENLNATMKEMVIEEIHHLTGVQLKAKQWEAKEADNNEGASVPAHRIEIRDLEKRHEVRSAQALFEEKAKNDCCVPMPAGKERPKIQRCDVKSDAQAMFEQKVQDDCGLKQRVSKEKRADPTKYNALPGRTPQIHPNLKNRLPLPWPNGNEEDTKGGVHERGTGVNVPQEGRPIKPETDVETSQSRSVDLEIPPPLPPKTARRVPRLPTPCTDAKRQDAESLSELCLPIEQLKQRLLTLVQNGVREDAEWQRSLLLVENLVLEKILKEDTELTSLQKQQLKDAEMAVDKEMKMGMKRQGVKNMAKCVLM